MTIDPQEHPGPDDRLIRPDAGHIAIRGGMLRFSGYGVGTLIGVATSILLLRYLGVDNYGRYATVTATVAVLTAVADLGIAVTGQRDFVVRRDSRDRRRLIANIVGLRILVTPLVAAGVTALTALVGFDKTMIVGVAIGGAAATLGLLAQSIVIPATASMQFMAITAVSLTRDIANGVGVLVLVVLGASLLGFLTIPAVAAGIGFAVALLIVGPKAVRVRVSFREWRPVVVGALPLGIAVTLSMLYLRTLLVLTSLLASTTSTGLYALSDRVVQVIVGAASVAFSASFPILAKSGTDDDKRFANALQQLFDVAVFASLFCVVFIVTAAEPIVRMLGGSEYSGSVPILRVQCLALIGSFLGSIWLPALVAIRRQRDLIAINAIGLGTVGVAGAVLIPAFGIHGTAAAAVIGEAVIALSAVVALVRVRPVFLPRVGAAVKTATAAAACLLLAFVSPVNQILTALVATLLFVVGAWLMRSVPHDLVTALIHRRSPRDLA